VGEGYLLGGVAVLKRNAGECELFHSCWPAATLSLSLSLVSTLSLSLSLYGRVWARCIVCGEDMEVATSLSTTA
jgi:hypothetical protein